MPVQYQPPVQPPQQPPVQRPPLEQPPTNNPTPISYKASDLETNNIRNESNNTQVDSSQIENSQVNVQQNFNDGNLQESWVMPHLSFRPKYEVSAYVTTDHHGNTQATVAGTYRFGHGKRYKRAVDLRLAMEEDRRQYNAMRANIEIEKHCAQLTRLDMESPSCRGVVQRIARAEVKQTKTVNRGQYRSDETETEGLW